MSLQATMVQALLQGGAKWNAVREQHLGEMRRYVFDGIDFPSGFLLDTHHFDKPVIFKNCSFVNTSIAFRGKHFTFRHCKFTGILSLQGDAQSVSFSGCDHENLRLTLATSAVVKIRGSTSKISHLFLSNIAGRLDIYKCEIGNISSQGACNASILFQKCTIESSNGNYFRGMHFLKDVTIRDCEILEQRVFENCMFKEATVFAGTRFLVAPSFHNVTFHQSTLFNHGDSYDKQFPDVSSEGAELCYRTLKLAMSKEQATAEALAFGRLELRARQSSERGLASQLYCLYNMLSNYGISYLRPALWLILVTVVSPFWIWLLSTKKHALWHSDYWLISISNTFPYLSSPKTGLADKLDDIIDPVYSFAFGLLSVLQSVVAAILLFLIGLGIRNHLRLK